MEQKEIMIRLKGITKAFPQKKGTLEVLHGIDLDIEKGEIFGIIGLSGAGKSTLVRCINLLERPTEGQVYLDGQELTCLSEKDLRQARRSMGMIFQQFHLLMQRTAMENVCFPMEIAGVKKAEAREKAKELLELVGLGDRMESYPSQLSGGQKQRVAIAGVMAMRPQCIILDEPTAMLDPNGRKDVIRTVHELNKKEGITVLLITHYMEEAIDADRVIVMDDGKVIMDGIPKEIFSRVKELKEHGLDVPQATELAFELKEAGMPLTEGILSRQELVEQLTALLSDEK